MNRDFNGAMERTGWYLCENEISEIRKSKNFAAGDSQLSTSNRFYWATVFMR